LVVAGAGSGGGNARCRGVKIGRWGLWASVAGGRFGGVPGQGLRGAQRLGRPSNHTMGCEPAICSWPPVRTRSRCRRLTIRIRSRHSRRTVAIHRSINAFARGARTGVRIVRMPSERNTSSNAAVNLLSRSWIRNRIGSPRLRTSERCCAPAGSPTRQSGSRCCPPDRPAGWRVR
jgi:hypothetical protein